MSLSQRFMEFMGDPTEDLNRLAKKGLAWYCLGLLKWAIIGFPWFVVFVTVGLFLESYEEARAE